MVPQALRFNQLWKRYKLDNLIALAAHGWGATFATTRSFRRLNANLLPFQHQSALECCNGAQDREHQFTGQGRGIDAKVENAEPDFLFAQCLNQLKQMRGRPC